jgi:hypothetical protein
MCRDYVQVYERLVQEHSPPCGLADPIQQVRWAATSIGHPAVVNLVKNVAKLPATAVTTKSARRTCAFPVGASSWNRLAPFTDAQGAGSTCGARGG